MKPALTLLEHIHQNMAKLGISEDLVQLVPSPPSKAKTERLMQLCDMVVVTGSQNNVRAGYKSGTPAIGVGAGNVVTIIDETADIDAAAKKITASKTFDNATSCSSENSVIALSSVYDEVVFQHYRHRAVWYFSQTRYLGWQTHWRGGKMTPTLLAEDIDIMISELSLESRANHDTRFLIVPQQLIDIDSPLTSEKMSRFLTLYRADDF